VPPPIELVIFDCDGVLVDTERLAVEIEARVLADVGWELTPEQIVERFVGRTEAHMLAEVERHIGKGENHLSWWLWSLHRILGNQIESATVSSIFWVLI